MADTEPMDAEAYLRSKFGAYRGHPEWRALEAAFNAGRATPPSPSTVPEVDERAAFESWAVRHGGMPLDLVDDALITDDGLALPTFKFGRTEIAWRAWHAALASRPAEVDASPKPPRTPEEMVAFIGSHFDAMRDETSDPEDIRFTLSVHDLLSAMIDWFDDYAESAYSNEKAAEVDAEGLPPLPDAWHGFRFNSGWNTWEQVSHWAKGDDDVTRAYTAEQYRQGQRDAVAADRARMLRKILDCRTEDDSASDYQDKIRALMAAPSHTTNKEK